MKVSCNSTGINTAVKIIKNGGIAIFPTDTVYGIGCDPYNKIAVESIYKIKNRVPSKLFPVLGYSKNELDKIAEFDERAEKIAEKFWPGRITLILKLKDDKIKQTISNRPRFSNNHVLNFFNNLKWFNCCLYFKNSR